MGLILRNGDEEENENHKEETCTYMDPVRVFSEIFVLTIVKVNRIGIVPRESASLEPFLDHRAAPARHQQVDEEHHHHQGCKGEGALYHRP